MRIFFLILMVAAGASLGFMIPDEEPEVEIVGNVLQTEKVTDIKVTKAGESKWTAGTLTDEYKKHGIGWELWRADIQVETFHFMTNSLHTNPLSRVTIYYEVDWSTNFMSISGIVSQYPPRRRFETNQVIDFYAFRPRWPDIETNGFHVDTRTNGIFPTRIVH
jgi:hypothetical protein